MQSTPSRRRSNQISAAQMRLLFLATFALASLGAFLSISGAHALYGAGWAILCMIAYAAFVWIRAPANAESEEFADSFYYLGFLLTLVGLIGVLAHLGDLKGEALLQGVLRQFGVALATTVVGLLGRIILIMFRSRPNDLEEATRRKAEEAYGALTQALDRMAAEAESFGVSFATRLNTALSPIEPAVQKIVANAERTAEGLEPLQQRLTALDAGLSNTHAKIQGAVDSFSKGLSDTGEQTRASLATAAGEVQSLLASIRGAAEMLGDNVEGSRENLARATGEYGDRLRETTEAVARTARGLSDLVKHIDGLASNSAQSLVSLGRDVNGLHDSIHALQRAMASVVGTLESQGTAIQGSLETWQENISALASLHDQLVREAEASAKAAADVRDEVAAGVRVLVHRLADGTETVAEA